MYKSFLFALSMAAVLGGTSMAYAHANGSGIHIAGPANAAVVIEEFVDFECKYCARGAQTVGEVLKNYGGKVKLVLRNLPLPFHANALIAAKAFSAVWLQNQALAYPFQQEIFDNQEQFIREGEAFLYSAALKVGADVLKMKADMNGEVVARLIEDDRQIAEAHGFKGTPSFMIGKERVTGAIPYSEFAAILDKQLSP